MSKIIELGDRIVNNEIKNEDLSDCLESKNYGIRAIAMFRIIERNYCDEEIVGRLTQLSGLLTNSKFIGPWQLGHVAIAALALLDDSRARKAFNEIFNSLSDTDKFLTDNFIQSKAYTL